MLLQGSRLHELGGSPESIEATEKALALSQRVGDRRIESSCSNTFGLTCIKLGEFDAGARHLQRAPQIFRDIANRRREGHALLNPGKVHLGLGQLDDNQQAGAILQETRVPGGGFRLWSWRPAVLRRLAGHDEPPWC